MRFEHGIEIQAGHMQGGEVIELLADALEVAPEKVVVADFTVHRAEEGLASPVFPKHPSFGNVPLRLPRAPEAVGEYLINQPAAEPIGRFEAGLIHRLLEEAGTGKAPFAVFGEQDAFAARARFQLKMIPVKAGAPGREGDVPPFEEIPRHAGPKHREPHFLPGIGADNKTGRRALFAPRHEDPEKNRGLSRDRAKPGFVFCFPGVKRQRHAG